MPGFLKTYADAERAARAVARSAALRDSDVPTPRARAGSDPRTVTFDHIEGPTGLGLQSADFKVLLEPVARLHDSAVPGLQAFDPFLRIRPRLSLTASRLIAAVLREPVPNGLASLHGDLHVGQFICDRDGKVWIVDLDDLAVGPPEADLANFTAHLVTSAAGSVAQVSARVLQAWSDLGKTCDDLAFQSHLRFALVRRHLKLREAGRADFEELVLGYLRDSSNFSIR